MQTLTRPSLPNRSQSGLRPPRTRRPRFSPLMLISVGVTLLVVLGAGVFVAAQKGLFTHAAGAVNQNCSLLIPNQPLTAQGLATPYQFSATDPAQGPCNEANTGQSAFVQAVIYDPATNTLSAYEPLVVDQGTQPAVAPVVPQIPQGSIVALWFGFNGTDLHLTGDTRNGRCVNGIGGSDFGQFSYCNAPRFFRLVNAAIQAQKITIPQIGTGNDGQPCPTLRSFAVVDMDQSDNVQTRYLTNGNGQTAQFSTANMTQLQNATTLGNPSDNALVSRVLDPALGCQAWQIPDLANNGTMTATLPTDELQAAAFQTAPIALVPSGDEMVLINNKPSLAKVNAYRIGVDQMLAFNGAAANTTTYCTNILNAALPKLQLDMQTFKNTPSPQPAVANSLFTFLASRLNATLGDGGLNCVGLLKIQNPVTLTTDGNGVVTNATLTTNGTGGNGATATLTVNGTAAQFTNGQAQVTINKLPATANVNGTAISITDGANNAQNNNAQNGQQQAAGAATLTINGTAVQFTNGQAQVTINKLPATATLNGTAITITDGANNGGGAATTLTVNGTATQFANGQAQVTINKLPATATLNGTAVSITDGANNARNNGQNNGAANTPAALIVNGTAVQFINGQAQVTINKLPATATLNGTAITITDGANNGGGNGGGGTTNAPNCVINGTMLTGCTGTVTINGQTCTISFANGTVNETCTAGQGGGNGGGGNGGGPGTTPTALPFNNASTSSDANMGAGNFDGVGFSYSAQALQNAGITPGKVIPFNGVSFTWPSSAPGTPDNVVAKGQTIPVTPVKGATTLAFLGASGFGPSSGTATITYTDGSTQTFMLSFSDWTLSGGRAVPLNGEQVVVNTTYRDSAGGMQQGQMPNVFYMGVTLQPGKTLQSVTLPTTVSQGNLHVFAISTK